MALDFEKLCHGGKWSVAWAEANINLPASESGSPGRYSSAYNPVVAKLFELIAEREPREVYLRKSSQCGASLHAQQLLIQQQLSSGGNALLVADSLKIARSLADRLEGIIDASFSDEMSYRTKHDKAIENKSFAKGNIYTVGAGSAGSLASRNGRIGVADEVDKHRRQTVEASSIGLLRQRLKTHKNSLLLAFSTPTDETGQISQLHSAAEAKAAYFGTCPKCGTVHDISGMWDFGLGGLVCQKTGEKLDNSDRLSMLENGNWELSGSGSTWGVQYSDILAKNIDIDTLEKEWKTAISGLPSARREFVQNRLGLPWSDTLEQESDILRALSISATTDPENPLLGEKILTVDVQHDCYKWMLSARRPSHPCSDDVIISVLEYGKAYEITTLLDKWVGKASVLVDDGGARTWEHRPLWAKYAAKGLRPTKGSGKQDRGLYWQGKFKINERDREARLPMIWTCDSGLKAYTLEHFEAGRIELPKGDIKDLIAELTSERPVTLQTRQGYGKTVWSKVTSTPNDWWDCLKLAMLADYIRRTERDTRRIK